MKIFQFFKLTRKTRKHVEEPKDSLTWIKHGFSEFFGTILLALSLAGLSIIVVNRTETVEAFFLHPIIVGFYAGFVAVGAVLFIFLRWSCDLNPAVTITRWIKGSNTTKYAIFKIIIQMVGGIIAGVIVYGLGTLGNGTKNHSEAVNHAISAIVASKKSLLVKDLKYPQSIVGGSLWIFFIELVMTSILLFPIFSKIISDKYRDFAIMFVISMSVWMGILGGSAAINPARGIAQQVPGLFWGHAVGNSDSAKDIISATIAMEAGTFLAPFFYVLMQGVLVEWVNPIVSSIIEYRNFRTSNMRKDPQVEVKPKKKTKK